ncbi:MAG: HAMP domain-containing sensor histidine kinase [Candidatus Nanopelagicales bacterium]
MRRRILLTLVASTSIVLMAFLVPLMVFVAPWASDRAQRQVVLEIQQPLVSRIPVAEGEQREQAMAELIATYSEQTGRTVTLYLPDDTIIGAQRPLDSAVELARERGSFFAVVPGGKDLLVPVYTEDGESVLRVFIPQEELTGVVPRVRVELAALGSFLLAVSVGLGLLLARDFLVPTTELSTTAGRLAGGDLTARVPPSTVPELDTAGRALNRLAERVGELLDLEREEVADLAHRLRTPMAALRLDSESLPTHDSADRLRTDVERLQRMVDEVIREARRPLREAGHATADLGLVARERAAFWVVLAEDQQRHLSVDIPSVPLLVSADERDIGDALDALIGNVFSHTEEGVPFHIAAGLGRNRTAWIEVADSGTGLPDHDVVERGMSVSGSTGLGLDIARRTAERAGGAIELGRSRTGGARVRLTFRTV